ncbi:pentatricopeptide repeat-containing protein MRL1, chloroplastic-like [Actinidia eriantha]|uniref:pentatricopeptide repeat-containing protein MRL1, chloroplastic-like n=1 Tax=Actinidia eriantha TaxID=165200 RepID=UPI0025859644|nr:pentatricopeptide repeat-containing protein MRL1, chloroplastic-like [Actinidia eriantha]
MDVSLSAKSQTLSLISFHRLSSSSRSSSFLYPARIGWLRREFIVHRSRRRCKNLGFCIRTPRFIFRASLDSQSTLLVVGVVTVSALTVFFLNHFRRKKIGREVSGPLFLAISQRVSGIMNQFVKNQSLGILGFERVMSVNERKHELKEMHEGRREYEDKPVQQQLKKTVLMPEETLSADTVESPGFSIIASSVGDSMSSRESEVTGFSSPPFVITQTCVPQPLPCMTDIPKQQFDGYAKENEFVSELHALIANAPSSEANGLVYNVRVEVDDYKRPFCELSEVDEIISYGGIFRESGREGLYTFFKANQSAVKSKSKLNGLKTLSSHASLQDKNSFSSQMRKSTTNGVKLSNQDFNHTTETIEGKIPLACYEGGSPRESTDFGRSRSFLREERRILPQDGHRYTLQPSHPNGIHVNDKNYPSRQMSAYNCLLKDGRLLDCLELLEDMEGKGLLDMDKVYHAGFFKYCQRQKAVKEAFRFTKLIRNPTLSTFNMLMSVCARSQDSEGAFEVMRLVQEAGLKADCKLYTTLISTCAKSGKVDAMFKVFHEMVNAEVEPNVHTYGALIDGCAKAGQVAKAFGAYGIMRSKKVKPDRVVFNALITACGQSGAVDRAFDVLAEMTTETQPIDPDQVTIGALIKACANVGQVDRARDAYNMIDQYHIKGTPEVYTIAVNSCSQTGDWEFACSVYRDMKRKGVIPDEMFLSALIDVAGHAGKVCAAFETLQEARKQGIHIGSMSYSSLMGACSNAKNWQKALELYEDIKSITLKPTVSTMNALITALCDGDQLPKALEVFSEMKRMGLCPNTITYSILLVASEKKDDVDVGLMLLSQAKKDGVTPNLVMSKCLIAMCLRRFEKACALDEPVIPFNSGRPQIDSKWTSLALMVYRETIVAGVVPTMELFSQLLGCLQLPHDASLKNRLIENLEVSTDSPTRSNLCSLVDGFGEYDPRVFSLFEEAASLGIVPCVSFKESPIVVDARKLQIHTAEVYLLTVLKGLKHRLAAGARLPNTTILLPTERTQVQSPAGEKTIYLAARIGQVVAALLRRLGLQYLGHESYGKIRIHGVAVKRWFKPKLSSPFSGKPIRLSLLESRLGKGISNQQRNIRIGNYFLD